MKTKTHFACGRRAVHVFFLLAFGVDARRWVDWILNPPRRAFKLKQPADRDAGRAWWPGWVRLFRFDTPRCLFG